MNIIEKKLRQEARNLQKIISEAEKRLKHVPQGNLRVATKKNRVEYYYKDKRDKEKNGKYVSRADIELVRRIAQRDYDLQLLKNARERKFVIEKFLQRYCKTDLKSLFIKMNPSRKALIVPVEISDEEYVKRWQEVRYEGKEIIDEKVIITERGERVRSKSEKIIADKLFYLGIPYRYEAPLVLSGNITLYPDFTILKMPERKEVFLEHLGMMDDMEYVNTTIFKLQTYERNGIYLGVQLYLTFETGRSPLNTKALDNLIKNAFEIQEEE